MHDWISNNKNLCKAKYVIVVLFLETKPGCSPGNLDRHRFPNHGPKYSLLPSR